MEKIISVGTLVYDGYDLKTALENLSQLGIRYVELDSIKGLFEHIRPKDFKDEKVRDKIKGLLQEFHLSCVSFSAHMDLTTAGAISEFERRMLFARELGVKIINTIAGPSEKLNIFYKNISSIDKMAKSLGLIIALETHGDIISHSESKKVLEKIASSNIKINYDFVNVAQLTKKRINLREDFASILNWVAHLHLKDIVLKEDIWDFTEIGKGEINYPEIFQLLGDCQRNIPVSIELPLRLRVSTKGCPWKTESIPKIEIINYIVKRSFQYVKKLLEKS